MIQPAREQLRHLVGAVDQTAPRRSSVLVSHGCHAANDRCGRYLLRARETHAPFPRGAC
jgi:hypothetical protein